jgi:hypothetical protein
MARRYSNSRAGRRRAGPRLSARPVLRKLTFLASLPALALAVSCDGRPLRLAAPTVPDAAAGADAALDAGAPAADAPPASYRGFVVAKVDQDPTPNGSGFQTLADFAADPSIQIACTSNMPGAENCCCATGIDLPLPNPPDADVITVASVDTGRALALLTPGKPTVDGGVVSSTLQGTSDLGIGWYPKPGVYPWTPSKPWNPGDLLRVSAPGDTVSAFAGSLRTGALLSGVTPALDGAAPLVIDRSQDFTISWPPEGLAGETVLLTVRQISSSAVRACFCSGPDNGKLTVGASVLGPYTTDQLDAGIQLERLITTTVTSDNAIIDLVGAVAVGGQVQFR